MEIRTLLEVGDSCVAQIRLGTAFLYLNTEKFIPKQEQLNKTTANEELEHSRPNAMTSRVTLCERVVYRSRVR